MCTCILFWYYFTYTYIFGSHVLRRNRAEDQCWEEVKQQKSCLESLQENKVKTWPVRSLTLAWLHATAESTHFRIFFSSLSSVFMMRCTVQSTHFRFETCRVVIPTSRRLSNGVLKTNYVQVRESWILIREAIRWHLQAKLIACPWKMEVERPSFLVWGNVAGASDFGSKGSIYCHRNLRAQKQCDTPPYWLGDWHRGQEDL